MRERKLPVIGVVVDLGEDSERKQEKKERESGFVGENRDPGSSWGYLRLQEGARTRLSLSVGESVQPHWGASRERGPGVEFSRRSVAARNGSGTERTGEGVGFTGEDAKSAGGDADQGASWAEEDCGVGGAGHSGLTESAW